MLEDRPDAHERLVAGAMAEPVVHRLEVVEVADHDAQRLIGAQGTFDLRAQLLVERQAILRPGERVGEGGLGEAAHQLGHAVSHRAQQGSGREQDSHQRDPARRHRIGGSGREQHQEVGGRHEAELARRLTPRKEVGRIEPEPDVEHFARQGRAAAPLPGVSGDEHGAQGHRRAERARAAPVGEAQKQNRDDAAHGGNGQSQRRPAARVGQQRDGEEDQRLATEDARGYARGKPRTRLDGRYGRGRAVSPL